MARAEESEKEILEAYLGWAVKRMLSMGNEAFSHYRHRFERMKPLADTITTLVFALGAKDPLRRSILWRFPIWRTHRLLDVRVGGAEPARAFVSSPAQRSIDALKLEAAGRHVEAIEKWKYILLRGFPRYATLPPWRKSAFA